MSAVHIGCLMLDGVWVYFNFGLLPFPGQSLFALLDFLILDMDKNEYEKCVPRALNMQIFLGLGTKRCSCHRDFRGLKVNKQMVTLSYLRKRRYIVFQLLGTLDGINIQWRGSLLPVNCTEIRTCRIPNVL